MKTENIDKARIQKVCALIFAGVFIFALSGLLTFFVFGRYEVVIHQPYCGVICSPEDSPIWQGEVKVKRPNPPAFGTKFASIDIDKVDIHHKIKMGSTLENLSDNSAAMYSGSKMPGDFGMTLIGGHSWFNALEAPDFGKISYLEIGDTFKITTDYGVFHYKVIEKHIERADTYPVDTKLAQNDRRFAVLYSCYPIDRTNTPDRVFVEADLVDGPVFE